MDQLCCIVNTLGIECRDEKDELCSEECFFSKTMDSEKMKSEFPVEYRKDVDSMDLLEKLLNVNPFHRITALDAIKHPYFENLFDKSEQDLLLTIYR
jgi:serine/threonine protein kinase